MYVLLVLLVFRVHQRYISNMNQRLCHDVSSWKLTPGWQTTQVLLMTDTDSLNAYICMHTWG